MKIIAVTQARLGSTRLPQKIFKKIGNHTLLDLHLIRVQKSECISKLIIATTTNPEDAEIEAYATTKRISCYRGSENDVLDRFYQAVKNEEPDYVVRVTSDCPLLDATLVDKVIRFVVDNQLDYGSNVLNPTYPDGQDVEVFKFEALEKAWNESTALSDREHVTPYLWRNSTFKGGTLFQSDNFDEGYDYEHVRMTVDEPKDYQLIKAVVEKMGMDKTWMEYTNFILENPNIQAINSNIIRNEGLLKSIKKDKQDG